MGGGGRDKGGDAGEPGQGRAGQGRVGQGEARRGEAKSATSSGQGPSGQWGGGRAMDARWRAWMCASRSAGGRESGSEGAYVMQVCK